MRVCILTHTFPRYEGDTAAPFMHGVAEGIAQNGNEVYILTPFSAEFKKNKQKKSYQIITYKYFWNKFQKLGYSNTLSNDMSLKPIMFLLSPFMIFFGTLALIKLVKEKKIEVINAHWILPNGFIASVVSLFTKTPVVSTLPGSDVYMAQKNIFFKLMSIFASLISRKITSNSPQLLEDLKKIGANDKKFQTIIYGVDPKKFAPKLKPKELLKRFQIKKDVMVVVGVGRLVAKKGFKYLIQAVKLVKHKKLKVIIVGEGDEGFYLKNLVKQLRLNDIVNFSGRVDYKQLVDYYNLADIFILPSIRDEKGNLDDQSVSVVEAMACGKPIITTAFPGYKIVVQNGVNGFLTPERDIKAIAQSIDLLASNKKKRQQMANFSRKNILENFSWKAVGKEYTDLFQSLKDNSYYSDNLPVILEQKSRLNIGRQMKAILKDYLIETKKLRCLDLGCSSGVITGYLSHEFKDTIGLDVDKKAIQLASKNNKRKNLKFILGDGGKLPFRDNSFDVVIANQLYEFVEDDKKVFKEIYRVLKKGGVCFFGARNKLAFIEAQYQIPFLSWIPKNLADLVISLLGKGDKFIGKYRTYWGLKKLVSRFKIEDYTLKILTSPEKYNYEKLKKYKLIAKLLPLKKLYSLLPNYIWLLRK